MPIPALTADGYLPAGEFDCDLGEVENTFGINDHRAELLDKFREFLAWLRDGHGLDLPYFVDGSYTTAKDLPGDIDFVLDLTNATSAQIGAALTLFFMHQEEIKTNFKVDYWFYHPSADKDLRQFFQYVRVEELQQRQLPPDTRKGILRIQP
ncbi:hypothetical protein [Silanimonas sp.]|uniref:DUF6932 family protein n=1 Tax=Silanimonas sp. TaxID=1929290 RepID=UPI0022C9035C|nr:hypothetical protein [Silanimonas sp.]MCZ8063081.1 hypothetical protein [Silanimonas sp.]